MGIFLIIIVVVILCWPWISRWFKQMLANRTEDYIRKATGMPPRPGSKEERRQQRASQQSQYRDSDTSSSFYGSSSDTRSRSRSRGRGRQYYNEPLIPREYAEDVEFVEIKNFSETIIGEKERPEKQYHESQVTDVDWVDIKKKA
ncbi:MAG: hypothetical protein HDR88_08255 [Bacteroides sp.]|nr:hypothetical protein [Bacteroides sp.]